jgi:hypothetical protein
MALLFWVQACGGGDSGSGVALRQQGGILLWQRGGILAGRGGILLRRSSILLWWGVGCGGSSMHILIDDAGKHVLYPLQRVLKDRCCVFRFDYDGGWQQCTEGRWDGKDGRDTSLCNGTDRRFSGSSSEEEMGTLMEVLPFIWVIMVIIREFYLESGFYSFSEPFVEASHVHLVAFYVGEAPFVNEELADAVEFSVVVPEFCSALYPILLLHVN